MGAESPAARETKATPSPLRTVVVLPVSYLFSRSKRTRALEIHPLVAQLRFTRAEFIRAVKGIDEKAAQRRVLPMNCISWNVGHLAWQEQRCFLANGQGLMPFPDIAKEFSVGAPASTPPLERVLGAWREITTAAEALAVFPWPTCQRAREHRALQVADSSSPAPTQDR